MQPIGMKRFASTHQVGTALVAGLLIGSALWVVVLGLTGHITAPRRQHAAAAQAIAPAGSSNAEQFFQAKLDQLERVAGRQNVAAAPASTAGGDRADRIAALGRPFDGREAGKARYLGATPADHVASIRWTWLAQISGRWVGRSGDAGAVVLYQPQRHAGHPHGARFTER